MSLLASNLINMSHTFLAETSASIAAGLPDGATEDVYTITDSAQELLWLTEGGNRLGRLCLPIYSTGSVAVTAGQLAIPYPSVTDSAGRVLHRPAVLSIGGVQLAPAKSGYLDSGFYKTDPSTGNPTGWADNNSSARLPKGYATTPTIAFDGYFLPTALTATTTPVDSFVDDFAARTIAYYNAWMIAQKNQDNPRLAARIAPCGNELITGIKEMYARLLENDDSLSAYFSPTAIDAMVQFVVSKNPRV